MYKTGVFYPKDSTSLEIRMRGDGSVVVQVGAVEVGTGALTSLAQIVAEEFGIAMDQVAIESGDTGAAPYDFGSVGSRTTFYAGNAARQAAREVREILFSAAALLLECAPEDVVLRANTAGVCGVPDRTIPLPQVVHRAELARNLPVAGRGAYAHGDAYDPVNLAGAVVSSLTFVGTVAEVDVDTETGKTTVRRLVMATDCGRAINPMLVEGQMLGSAAMALGYALSENARPFGDAPGEIVSTLFDYSIPTTLDMPPMDNVLLETPDPEGPFGARGVAEVTTVTTAAAVCNAIHDAVGVRLYELPATPERVLQGLRSAGQR
jgi:CO/xanthine dehydrogenase Mo-binding subunit